MGRHGVFEAVFRENGVFGVCFCLRMFAAAWFQLGLSIIPSFFTEKNQARGRFEIHKILIYKYLTDISSDWTGLKRLIRVER